jgi:hypothetical protein
MTGIKRTAQKLLYLAHLHIDTIYDHEITLRVKEDKSFLITVCRVVSSHPAFCLRRAQNIFAVFVC